MGSHYGSLPVHDALWHSAEATAHSLPARLAVEHCVHEARGWGALCYPGQGWVHTFRAYEYRGQEAIVPEDCAKLRREEKTSPESNNFACPSNLLGLFSLSYRC